MVLLLVVGRRKADRKQRRVSGRGRGRPVTFSCTQKVDYVRTSVVERTISRRPGTKLLQLFRLVVI